MSSIGGNRRDQPFFKLPGNAHIIGDAVLCTMNAFAIAELAQVIGGATARAVGETLGAGLGAHVLGRGETAHTAGFTPE